MPVDIRSINPVLRAVGIISAVAILVSGVTFAALQSQVTLTDNTISTAGAVGLQIDNLENETGPGTTDRGFEFADLVPGGGFSEAQQFALSNTEFGPDMTIKVHSTAATTSAPVDKSLVWVRFTLVSETTGDITPLTVGESVEVTLADLESSFTGLPGATLPDRLDADETLTYDVQVRVGADAVNSPEVNIEDFDLVFTATVVDDDGTDESPTPEPTE
jgi:hypothetical protein